MLGAGVMGAQIAAHCVNAKVPVVLFDLPDAKGPNKNGIVLRAIENLKKLNPAPLGNKDDAVHIQPANYEENLELLRGCDVIIEAIAERMDWKHDLYRKVAPFVSRKCDLRVQHVGPADRKACRSDGRWAEGTLLRRPFFQSTALHASGRVDSDACDAAGDPRRP